MDPTDKLAVFRPFCQLVALKGICFEWVMCLSFMSIRTERRPLSSKAAKGSGMDSKVSTRTLNGVLGRVQESGVMGPTCACSLCMQL